MKHMCWVIRKDLMSAEGAISLPCKFSVAETADRLESLLKSKGIKIFARIDQAAEARAAGLSMPETILIIFGDPKTGTPLMVKYPSLALDLPLKALIWQSAAEGKVWLTYSTPEYLKTRHRLDSAPFGSVATLLESATR
jgi:uncharacterized protein (DUF302 family)